MSEWKLVGKVKDAHGLQGELLVLIFSGQAEWKTKLKKFMLANDQHQENIFSVHSLRETKNGLVIKCKNIVDRTAAEKWVGQMFSIPADLLISAKGERIFLQEILHFQVVDQVSKQNLGEI